jgi:hypothetical protein
MSPLFAVLALAVGAPNLKDPPAKDGPSLVGEWVVERMAVDGTAKVVPAGTTWAFAADRTSTLTVGRGTAPDSGTYATDPKGDPPAVDIALGPGGGPCSAGTGWTGTC